MPYVLGHGEWPHGNTWLFEAVLESYIPLLNLINRLDDRGLRSALTWSMSPIVTEQLLHPQFSDLLIHYIRKQIHQAETDLEKFHRIEDARWNIPMGTYWKAWYQHRMEDFTDRYATSIPQALRQAQEKEILELMPTSLTHSYLPLLQSEHSINMQIAKALSLHERVYHHRPHIMWLPECGYSPRMNTKRDMGLEEYMLLNDVRATIINQTNHFHIVDQSSKWQELPEYLQPMSIVRIQSNIDNKRDLSIMIRHQELCSKIWSENEGFPSHADYLEFHKKEYDSSLKYWRVTDRAVGLDKKQPYSPHIAKKKAKQHAREYVQMLETHAREYAEAMNQPGVICLAFDTELFGHWWFEGPHFLESLIEQINQSEYLNMTTYSESLDLQKELPIVQCSRGSWGANGNDDSWLNEHTKSIWENIHHAEKMMNEILEEGNPPGRLKQRIAELALRELMLMQASDWTWLISMNKASDYARQRFEEHYAFFEQLISIFRSIGDSEYYTKEELIILQKIEQRDDILQDINIDDWHYSSA